jgi:hypothetical protein
MKRAVDKERRELRIRNERAKDKERRERRRANDES